MLGLLAGRLRWAEEEKKIPREDCCCAFCATVVSLVLCCGVGERSVAMLGCRWRAVEAAVCFSAVVVVLVAGHHCSGHHGGCGIGAAAAVVER